MILQVSGPDILQVKTRLLLTCCRLSNWALRLGLRKTPLFRTRVVFRFVRNLLLSRKVRVSFLGWGRMMHAKCTFNLVLLFSSCTKPGWLLVAATTRTLCRFVVTRASTGQRTTGPLQIGSSRPSILWATGYNWDFAFFVNMTFPIGLAQGFRWGWVASSVFVGSFWTVYKESCYGCVT